MERKKDFAGTISSGDSRPGDAELRKHLRRVPFLAVLSEGELEELEKVVIQRKFFRDEVVLWEEDTSRYFYLIYAGKVKVVKVDSDGREHILAIHRRGGFFGEVGILDGKTSPATVIAMDDTEVGLIAKHHFENYLLSNQKVLRELLQVFCERLRESWLKLKVLGFTDAERRVRAVLGLIGQQSGVADESGNIALPQLTHSDIAHFASLSRETVTRNLKKLSRAKEILILENRQIILTPEFFQNSQFM